MLKRWPSRCGPAPATGGRGRAPHHRPLPGGAGCGLNGLAPGPMGGLRYPLVSCGDLGFPHSRIQQDAVGRRKGQRRHSGDRGKGRGPRPREATLLPGLVIALAFERASPGSCREGGRGVGWRRGGHGGGPGGGREVRSGGCRWRAEVDVLSRCVVDERVSASALAPEVEPS